MENVNIFKLSEALAETYELDADEVLQSIKDFLEKTKAEKNVVLVTDYSEKSSALFGTDKEVWDKLKGLNEDKKKVVTFNNKLAFGPGIVITGKHLKLVKECLEENDIDFEEKKRGDYEKEFTGEKASEKKTKSKKDSSVEKVKVKKEKKAHEEKKASKTKATDEKKASEEKKASKTKASKEKKETKTSKSMPASKSAPRLKAKQNGWENFEDEETGIVFLKLKAGENGKETAFAVGVQDHEAEEDAKGLDSVTPMDDEVKKECKKNKFKVLDDKAMTNLKKYDKKMHKKMEEFFSREDEEEASSEE